MDLSGIPLFAALNRKMAWLADRQRVLSENIANVNTPGYQANDLKPFSFEQELGNAGGKLELVSTSPQHLQGGDAAGRAGANTRHNTDDRTIAGNTVSMEDEMMKVAQTGADYGLMTNLYKKQLSMFKDAIGRGGAG